ncbi:barstar family protein [Nostoc sp. WHI]|uniref:barstar family protein n=1 Tax=Nostoc sp. WHI TaxID=2650611 RepID=UPI0018C5E430|nr:barstar family protein [Nostoc sp. WHI]MBG1271856.1 barstar family protein [Nostoc sp. WHI]
MSEFLNISSIDIKQGIRKVVEKIAAEPGTKVFYLDGKKINSKETFLSKAAEAMQFPTYFGANWDAFDECITDLTWCPAQRYVIFYDHADIFAQAEPTQYQIALDIINSAKEYWEANNIYFKFLVINK